MTENNCIRPDYLKKGDKVALISPSYHTPMENVDYTAELLRRWGLVPVIGPNVGKIDAGRYAGTLEERLSDICWALEQADIKAIICNRGGYGTIKLIGKLTLKELADNPKWLVGYSDISTLHGLWTRAGVMSIHGAMSSSLPRHGADATGTLLRDILFGTIPAYQVPAHPQNIEGKATGVLVGGNICTFSPNLGTDADSTMGRDFILLIEDVEESMHNIDRQLYIMEMHGALKRCKGVILGEFTDCSKKEFSCGSVEAMLHDSLKKYGIPVLCGFPAGHGDVNLPLVMGAPVTIDVRDDGASIQFSIDGMSQDVLI